MFEKLKKFYYFHLANPVVAKGEGYGFKYVFRRYWLELATLSGNWNMRVTASEHPYAYLLTGIEQGNEKNIFGFAETLYFLNATLTRDQALVDDVRKAMDDYASRVEKTEVEEESEAAAIEEVRQIQEYVDATTKERRKMERDSNGRFKKAVKMAQDLQ